MNSRHLSLPSKDTSISFTTPLTSPTFHPKEVLNAQEASKNDYVAELKKKYNQRLMKPLQVNHRLKLHGNMGIIDSGRERRKLQRNLLPTEDVEGKYLVKQVKELSHLAAVHDKKMKAAKAKLKRTQSRNVLEQHLGEDICDYIKAVNDRADKLKRIRSLEDTKLYNEAKKKEKRMKEELEDDTENKDPLLEIIHSQPQPQVEESKQDAIDLKLRMKQLNSNTQFRHSQRKLLFLRSMEASIITSQQEETGGESITANDIIRDLKRQDSTTLSKQEISRLLPNPTALNDKTNQSIMNIQDRRGRSFVQSKSSLHTLIPPGKEGSVPVKSYDLVFSKKDRRNYFIDTGGCGDMSSIGITSTEVYSAIDHHPKGLEIDLQIETDGRSQADSDFTPHALRLFSQPNFKGIRTPEIPEKEEDEVQTGREEKQEYVLPSQEETVVVEQEKQGRSKRPKLFKTNREEVNKGMMSEDNRRIALYHDKETGKRIITHIEDSVVDEPETFVRSPKDEFRAKLLENQKKMKNSKNMTFSGSFQETAQAQVQKGWLGTTQNALIEPTKWKVIERVGKRGKSKRKGKGRSTRNTRGERATTEIDQEAYLRDLSAEKTPLRQEMQGLLTKYGYKDSVVEIGNMMPQKQQKALVRLGSQDAVNKEKLGKVEKFLEYAYQKSTKVSKID